MHNKCCRLCLGKLENDIYFLLDAPIRQKFMDITQLDLEISKNYPSLICSPCLNELDKIHQYRASLIEKEIRLKGIVKFMMGKSAEESENSETQFQQEEEEGEVEHIEDQDDREEEEEVEEESDKKEVSSVMYEEFVDPEQEPIEFKVEVKYPSESEYMATDMEMVEERISQEDKDEEQIHFVSDQEEEQEEEIEDKKIPLPTKSFRRDFSESDKIYRCWIEDCEATFPFRISLKRHMQTIHNLSVSKSSCLICGQDFQSYSEFLTHSKIHRRFNCELCQSTFSKRKALESHLERFHNTNDKDERPYFCPNCNARFKRKEHLKSHIAYKHSTERKFKCLDCSMSFFQKMDLKNHSRIHTGEKAFKCSRCTLDFRDLKSLKRHNFIAHGTRKIYVCDLCSADFELHKEFIYHRKTHQHGSEVTVRSSDETHEVILIPMDWNKH